MFRVFELLTFCTLSHGLSLNGLSQKSVLTNVAKMMKENFSKAVVSAALVPLTLAMLPLDARASEVYFGVGCFWHVQHEFTQAEKKLLGRDDSKLTVSSSYIIALNDDTSSDFCC
jgi:hypothetical protein